MHYLVKCFTSARGWYIFSFCISCRSMFARVSVSFVLSSRISSIVIIVSIARPVVRTSFPVPFPITSAVIPTVIVSPIIFVPTVYQTCLSDIFTSRYPGRYTVPWPPRRSPSLSLSLRGLRDRLERLLGSSR